MTQTNLQGGILRPDEVAKAQYEMNQSMSEGGSSGSGNLGGGSGGGIKPSDKIRAKNDIYGVQSGGMVEEGDKVEAQSEMFKR